MGENEVAVSAIDAALKVHRTFGPGLLESVYEAALTLASPLIRNRPSWTASW